MVLYEARQASQLRAQVQLIRQQQAPLSRQIEELSHQREEAARQLAVLRNENERLSRNTSELLRLRGEIARLRNAAQMPGKHETKKEGENAFTLVRVGPLLLPIDSDDNKLLEELKFENEAAIQNPASNKLASLKTFLNLSAEQEEQVYALLLRQMALEDNNLGGIRSVSFVGLLEMSMLTPMEFSLMTSDISAERAVENHEAIARADEQFKTLLSPDQQSVYEQYKKDQISTRARQLANGQAKGLTETLGLTSEQQDKVSAALFGIWSAAPDPIAGSDFSQWFREQNLKALEGILSLEQMMQARRLSGEPAN